MRPPVRLGIALALFACIAGCAAPRTPTVPTATVTPPRTKPIPADSVKNAISAGKSTKADVNATLGEGQVISFDSGFEIWVYRLTDDTPAKGDRQQSAARGEFVVLFAPSGLVAKTRLRPAPPRTKESNVR